jgi:hypothetical protein
VGPGTAHTAVALSIAISGNHFVNGAGQTVRLLGVDREGTEYAAAGLGLQVRLVLQRR